MQETGRRFNKGKRRWRNVPMFILRGLIDVGAYGEEKYDTYNFLKGLPVSDTLDSAMRHIDAFQDPDQSDYDEESGLHHLFHAAWNLLIIPYHTMKRPELDDRFKGFEE